jgi:hypothetical protein
MLAQIVRIVALYSCAQPNSRAVGHTHSEAEDLDPATFVEPENRRRAVDFTGTVACMLQAESPLRLDGGRCQRKSRRLLR